MPAHRLLEALHVAVDVAVEEREKQAEVLRVALVGRRRHQQVVVGALGKRLAELEGERLLLVAVGTHLVGLVHDDEIPAAAEQALLGVLDPRDPRHRGHDLVLLLPGVLAVLASEDLAAHHLEGFPELVLHLPLPLEREIRGRNDQRALDETADLELLKEQPSHDRLAGARVVGEQEADAREREEVLVDRLELVGQRVDACDRERKVRVVLVGQCQAFGLDAEAEADGVPIEGLGGRRDCELRDLSRAQDRIVDLAGAETLPDELHRLSHGNRGDDLDRSGSRGPRTTVPGASDEDVGSITVALFERIHKQLHARRTAGGSRQRSVQPVGYCEAWPSEYARGATGSAPVAGRLGHRATHDRSRWCCSSARACSSA